MVETYRPASLSELLSIRAETGAIPFAGGTDLMVRLRRGAGILPAFERPVVFLDLCEQLKGIETSDTDLLIGAAASMSELLDHPAVHPALKRILREIAAPALRNAATLGGNICNASPAADTLPFLYAFDAMLELASVESSRSVAIADFISGPGSTILNADEVLTGIRVPRWNPDIWYFRKVGTRKANALTKISFAGFADKRDGRISRLTLTLGSVFATIVRLHSIEESCNGLYPVEINRILPSLLDEFRGAVRPIDDQRSTAEYRAKTAENLFKHFMLHELAGERQ
ncbi:MAG: molybdopterin dehydrogenase [Spirochaetales bacterium]|jgi:xanthine dehydrogenase FAD-binding subunit|nr:molybdopterin dehydrogenase [Spirochaetales bacterium]